MPFLEERKQSILNQSLQDFEVVIVDDGSQDGAREFLLNWSQSDPRVRFFDGPRKGLYAGWNECVKHCRGKYVYFATSDDSMVAETLEHMAECLELNRDCDICYTPLIVTDSQGNVMSTGGGDDRNRWLCPGWTESINVRPAPYDGILYFAGRGQYGSITQLLLQKRVFEKIGYFREDIGPVADYEWTLRACLRVGTVYSQKPCGTWRLHDAQATAKATGSELENLKMQLGLIKTAILAECHEPCALNPIAKRMAKYWYTLRILRILRRQAMTSVESLREFTWYCTLNPEVLLFWILCQAFQPCDSWLRNALVKTCRAVCAAQPRAAQRRLAIVQQEMVSEGNATNESSDLFRVSVNNEGA